LFKEYYEFNETQSKAAIDAFVDFLMKKSVRKVYNE